MLLLHHVRYGNQLAPFYSSDVDVKLVFRFKQLFGVSDLDESCFVLFIYPAVNKVKVGGDEAPCPAA